MPVSLTPEAPNQPDGLLRRVENTKRRILYFGEIPNSGQIDGFGQVLSVEVQEAYRFAVQREAEKFGIILRGTLDEFTRNSLDSYARNRATSIVSTYIRKQNDARNQGKDLKEWRKHYANWKAPQVLQHEYARADGQAVMDFYNQSQTPDGGLLDAQARVMPLESAVHDDCELWISYGWISLHEILDKFLPRHPNCPHFWSIFPGHRHVGANNIPDLPVTETPIWLPNTTNLMPTAPSLGKTYSPESLLNTVYTAGMGSSL